MLSALENTPPELYADIVKNGIWLSGGVDFAAIYEGRRIEIAVDGRTDGIVLLLLALAYRKLLAAPAISSLTPSVTSCEGTL